MTESRTTHRASRGDQAIAHGEEAICGTGAVATVALAEGLALAGVRAARLLGDDDPRPSGTVGASSPWVLHRTTAQRGAAAPFGAFELVAATGQEAVDLCLVAHVAGLAGECLVDAAFAKSLVSYQPLDAAAIEPVLAEAEAREHVPADQDAVHGEVIAAFSRTARATGRAVEPVVTHRTSDADVVIVALGEARIAAQKIAEGLRAAGVSCGVIGITLLRPFPVKELAPLLVGKTRVLVFEQPWSQGRLHSGVSAAVRAAGGKAPSIHDIDASQTNALDAAAKHCGVTAKPVDASGAAVVLAALPGGPRAEHLLLDVAARVAPHGAFALARQSRLSATAELVLGSPSAAGHLPIDVAFAAHPVLLDAKLLESALADGAKLVVPGDKPEAVWAALSPLQREVVARKKLRLMAFDAKAGASSDKEAPYARWEALTGGFVAAAADQLASRLSCDAAGLGSVALKQVLRQVDTAAPPKAPAISAAPDQLPKMPKAPQGEPDVAWRDALRRFHLTGAGASGFSGLLPLAPLAASGLIADIGGGVGFPFLIDFEREPSVQPLGTVLGEILGEKGSSFAVVKEHLARLISAASAELDAGPGIEPVAEALGRALTRFSNEFSVSDAARKGLDEEVAALRKLLPVRGQLLALGPHAHLALYASVVTAARRQSRAKLIASVRALAERLNDLLRVEASRTVDAAGLGDFVDVATLSKSLPERRGPQALSPERKARIERLLGILSGYVKEDEIDLSLVHSGSVPDELDLGRAQRVRHADGFGVAAGLFDGMARRMAEVVGALRAARDEVDGRADAATDAAPVALDWQGFTRDELLAIPPILVVESAERIWQGSLDALSGLLRSGRPVHVLVEQQPGVAAVGLGNVLVAHYDAFVAQSTLARPVHLADTYAHMARRVRPAVTLVAPRPAPGPMPAWLELAAMHEGRAAPCFRYDPDAGGSFAECFDIDENPQPETVWPRLDVEAEHESGSDTLSVAFTFADAAALGVALREHFWVIPTEAWSDEQIELERYLAALGGELPTEVPFIWTVQEDGTLARAVVTRRLAFECAERGRSWHALQELGGSDNEHARRAAEAARRDAEAAAEARRAELEQAHAAEIERIRKEEASEALSRLAQALLNPDALLAAPGAAPRAAPAPAPAPAAAEAAPAAAAAAPPPPAEEEAVSFSDPFIDTPLCTSCNECTNLNPQMFKYNADKQAELADVKAGTFLQLVTAAEKCPAACIHPGAPRKDDSTATDDVVARAARFN
jgi:ferredoxin